ncbi:hydrogenase maturation protein HypF [Methanosarcina thermophila]|jgi:hydrogenase maturation protein HypF|uniref:Carbamoyltransferase n=3 Tax=Methanosarcina thermophila TaxID=2210 RepID=A0A1I6YJM6_METTE|nr:carbamoyltransferase HypF [Methanosarcina thermophila]ALK05264.1 MAG: hydrogenase expression protein [Methanosarcina sp. 795]AKB14037.1 [NiFe] hydrogenase metallocenter assembly protein HypF [Methanosarcina thermophila TM-1]AKB15319.1 [NiFe] hydrogenase metallocenter assembly protein HypF [Methanosarcina thermophila CHTI-55]NLU56219.1 carbamoyltransferase HypF [Methanosarcina thermophila]SFT50557.1 hydrogenase maturation protein HypF [Methanosarcina thermophila]
MKNEARLLHITGTVQGVGFRPFIYQIAKAHGLFGYVKNLGNYVEILLEGNLESLDNFLADLLEKKPPLAKITEIKTKNVPVSGYSEFIILPSESGVFENSIIPPDTAICEQCKSEIFDPSSRYYHYPFTVCTNCGPRYTTVRSLPYDRKNTSMADFPLCPECEKEYTDPLNRRYHAQPVCCPKCGPEIWLSDSEGNVLAKGYKAIACASDFLQQGFILAIKGFGGFHIACNARKEEPVKELRRRLKRPEQPFAVMANNARVVETFAEVEGIGGTYLSSYRRPITILPKSKEFNLAESVSPGLHNIGVMLPYTGTQTLLFDRMPDAVYVMTSANLPGRPMVIENKEALEKLKGIADYFLLHNRVVANRNDDTVIRIVNGQAAFIRRSRGYVPEPVELPFEVEASIGVGAEMNSTVTVAKGKFAYISQYIGNTSHVETFKYHSEVVRHLIQLTGIEPLRWSCDLHPAFNTTRYALKMGGENTLKIQHHIAHMLALMADNSLPLDSKILGIALDGVGYGSDGAIWGGELFESSYLGHERIGHLLPQPMPGGDLASKIPSRMVLGILFGKLGREELEKLPLTFPKGTMELSTVMKQLETGVNVIQSSSTGRVLDAAAAMLGICGIRTYDGEPAMKLESAARMSTHAVDLPVIIKKDRNTGVHVLDTTELLLGVYELSGKYSSSDLAFAVEENLAKGISEIAISLAAKKGLEKIGLSGGVAYNDHITSCIARNVKEAGFEFLAHHQVPCGDGCISFGQALAAGLSIKLKKEF